MKKCVIPNWSNALRPAAYRHAEKQSRARASVKVSQYGEIFSIFICSNSMLVI